MSRMKNWRSYVLIAVCVFINLIGRDIAAKFQMPFWLDSIGTLIAAMELGPVGGAISGVLMNVIIGTSDLTSLPYMIVSIVVGVSAGILFSRSKSLTMFRVLAGAVFIGLLSVMFSTPLSLHMYNGRTGNIWGDGLIDMISRDVNVPLICSFLGDAFVNVPDKVLSVLIATGVVKIHRYLTDRRKKKVPQKLALIVLVPAMLAMIPFDSKAMDMSAEYAAITYDTDDGLATMEINTITQTPDGYIYAGTYAGLYRCDGYKFEEIVLDERISNVMQLFVDSKGNLWVGTNDSGMARYNPKNGEINYFTTYEGLPSNSVREFCEDLDGNVYAATATKLCMLGTDGRIKVFEDEELYGVRSLSCNGKNVVAGVTNGGELFFLRKQKLVNRVRPEEDDQSFGAVAAGDNDDFLVGTTSNYVVRVTLNDNDITQGRRYTISDAEYFNKIMYSEENGGYFYCCESGNGFLTKEGIHTDLSTDSFSTSVSDVMVDYQKNIWFASNKQGILRYSWNPFMDIFAKAKVQRDVVNCVLVKDGLLYVGTNSGLMTIDLKTYYAVPITHPEVFNDTRVRDIMDDSNGNIWVSTYGKFGLIEIRNDGKLQAYNDRNKGTEGGKFRSTLQLSDGTIVAATSQGLNYIRSGVVIKTMGEKEGLTTQILSMVETADGAILAGTDGDGILIIDNGEIKYKYARNEGMESLVVLKIVPCGEDSYIYVTSNALYYYKDNAITRLTNFPYNNNYDVHFTKDGYAWVNSSAGVYVVKKDDLLNNVEGMRYTLLNKGRGLYSTLTANSRNALDGDYLYLCCTDGVRRIAINGENFVDKDYTISISSLKADGQVIEPDREGNYTIPATSGRITFDVAVLNFTLSNPLLHIYLEGSDDPGIVCTQKDMEALGFMNLPYGDYKLKVEVFDSAGINVVRQESFNITKESQIFEREYFKVYLYTVCALFIVFIGWMIGRIGVGFTSLERWQKEAKIDPMTGFWNKGYSQQALMELCKNTEGILMVIDLDNFKLVNDVFGHEMGDKVLVKFSELIRSCIREDDFIGRIGGDEFVAFIQGTSEEEAVAEKERYLNEQILKSGEQLMGEEMGIPLGVSIGAVSNSEEDGDYMELFRKADKALYNVKQNGKHGYSMYRSENLNVGTGEIKANGVAGIRMILEERGAHKGAYLVDLDKLQMVYRLFARMAKRTIVNVWIVQFILSRKDGKEVDADVMQKLIDVLSANLRSNDVMAPNGKNQMILILTDISENDGQTPIDRIMKAWNMIEGHEEYELTYETDGMHQQE